MHFEIITTFKDQTGRILLIECKIENNEYVIVNVYTPTKNMPQEQMNFLSNLRDVLYNYSDKALIIGGDFNACLDPTLDKKVIKDLFTVNIF